MLYQPNVMDRTIVSMDKIFSRIDNSPESNDIQNDIVIFRPT